LAGILFFWALAAKCKTSKKSLLLILRIAVRLLLLGLYKTSIETSLRILNCRNRDLEGKLVWKDGNPCPLGGDDQYLAVIGIILLVSFGLLPYLYIFISLCRHGRPKEQDGTQSFNYVMYGWATEGYKSYAYFWEPVNALIILLTVMAAELLDESQQLVQASIAGASIIVHLIVRPYDDRSGNVVVILFGICELFGVLGAEEDLILQWIHLIALIVAVLILLVCSVIAAVGAVHEKREQLRFGKSKDRHYNVSKTEGVMVTPLLTFLLFLLSPFLIMSIVLRYLVHKTTTPASYKFSCLPRLAKLFMYPLAIALAIVKHSILGDVLKSIGYWTEFQTQEKIVWLYIKEMTGFQTTGLNIVINHPELLGEPIFVAADVNLHSQVLRQVGYAKYEYVRTNMARSGDDITVVFAHAPPHTNKIILHLLKELKVSLTFPEGVAPGKIIVSNKTSIIFEVPEIMINENVVAQSNAYKTLSRSCRSEINAETGTDIEAGHNIWENLNWKERWEISDGEWKNKDLVLFELDKHYLPKEMCDIVHPTSDQHFSYTMLSTIKAGSVLNVRHAPDGRLWVNGQEQGLKKKKHYQDYEEKINDRITTLTSSAEQQSTAPLPPDLQQNRSIETTINDTTTTELRDIGSNWHAHLDPTSKNIYYRHTVTGATQWEWPTQVPRKIGHDWYEKVDPTSNTKYYHNARTGATQWEWPREVNKQVQELQPDRTIVTGVLPGANTTVKEEMAVKKQTQSQTQSSPSLSTKEQHMHNAIKTIQHELTLKITNLSPERQSKFFQLFTQPNGVGGLQFVKLLVSMLKGSAIKFTRPLLSAVWLSIRQKNTDQKTINLNDLKVWCNTSFKDYEGTEQANENWQNAKTVMHQQHASIQSHRIQQKAHDASIDHQNRMLKKKHTANRRLQKRLSARGGSAVLPASFQVQPLAPIQKTSLSTKKVVPIGFNSLVTNYVDQHETATLVVEIRQKSETARQNKLNEVNAWRKSSALQLQRRLSQRVTRGTGNI